MKINLLLLIQVLFIISCEKLDEDPYNFVTPDQFYKTEADAEASLIGIYSTLDQANIYNMTNNLGSVGLTLDSRHKVYNSGDIQQGDENMLSTWQYFYEAVRKANTSVDNITASPLGDNIKNRYIAEAKAIRAFSFFRLTRFWGDVPMRLTAAVQSDDQEVTSMKDVYVQIIEDLEWAIPYLWKRAEKPTGRMTQSAGQALLANVYLTIASSAKSYDPATSAKALKPYHDAFNSNITSYYQRCKELSQEVINGPYMLLANWMDLWGRGQNFDNRNNNEFIWASQTVPGVWGHSWGNQYTPHRSEYAPAADGQYMGLTYEFVKSYDPQDLRFTNGMIWEYNDLEQTSNRRKYVVQKWRRNINDPEYPYPNQNGTIFENADTLILEDRYWALLPKKFFDQTYTVSGVGAAVVMPYLRMAEVYLMYAEAENELNGVSDDAIQKINAVRSRVNLPLYTAGQFTIDEFRNKILDERLWEFAMEGKDYHDLVRMGQLEERCYGVEVSQDGKDAEVNPRSRDADDYWLPYPNIERTLNDNLKNIERMNYN